MFFYYCYFFRNQSRIKVSFIQINDEDEHIHDAKLKKKKIQEFYLIRFSHNLNLRELNLKAL